MSFPAVSELAAKFVPSVSRVNAKDVNKVAARLFQWSMSSRTVCLYDLGAVKIDTGMLAHSPNKACTGRREDLQTLIRWHGFTPKDNVLCGDLESGKLTS